MKSTSISEERKQHLARFMTAQYMSSEESMSEEEPLPELNTQEGNLSSDDEEPPRKKILVCRPLPWRSQELNNVIQLLERKASRKRGARSASMVIERRIGAPSRRPAPDSEDLV